MLRLYFAGGKSNHCNMHSWVKTGVTCRTTGPVLNAFAIYGTCFCSKMVRACDSLMG